MTSYKIERWDPILLAGEVARPMVYVKADDRLRNLLETTPVVGKDPCADGNGTLKVVIKNSDEPSWEGSAILRSSEDFPISRPEFFKKHNYYVFVLNKVWTSYPAIPGELVLLGAEPLEYIKFVEGYEPRVSKEYKNRQDSSDPLEDETGEYVIKDSEREDKDSPNALNKNEIYVLLLGISALVYLLYAQK